MEKGEKWTIDIWDCLNEKRRQKKRGDQKTGKKKEKNNLVWKMNALEINEIWLESKTRCFLNVHLYIFLIYYLCGFLFKYRWYMLAYIFLSRFRQDREKDNQLERKFSFCGSLLLIRYMFWIISNESFADFCFCLFWLPKTIFRVIICLLQVLLHVLGRFDSSF